MRSRLLNQAIYLFIIIIIIIIVVVVVVVVIVVVIIFICEIIMTKSDLIEFHYDRVD